VSCSVLQGYDWRFPFFLPTEPPTGRCFGATCRFRNILAERIWVRVGRIPAAVSPPPLSSPSSACFFFFLSFLSTIRGRGLEGCLRRPVFIFACRVSHLLGLFPCTLFLGFWAPKPASPCKQAFFVTLSLSVLDAIFLLIMFVSQQQQPSFVSASAHPSWPCQGTIGVIRVWCRNGLSFLYFRCEKVVKSFEKLGSAACRGAVFCVCPQAFDKDVPLCCYTLNA